MTRLRGGRCGRRRVARRRALLAGGGRAARGRPDRGDRAHLRSRQGADDPPRAARGDRPADAGAEARAPPWSPSCATTGLFEVIERSFTAPETLAKLRLGQLPALRLANPMSEDLSATRPTPHPALLDAAQPQRRTRACRHRSPPPPARVPADDAAPGSGRSRGQSRRCPCPARRAPPPGSAALAGRGARGWRTRRRLSDYFCAPGPRPGNPRVGRRRLVGRARRVAVPPSGARRIDRRNAGRAQARLDRRGPSVVAREWDLVAWRSSSISTWWPQLAAEPAQSVRRRRSRPSSRTSRWSSS